MPCSHGVHVCSEKIAAFSLDDSIDLISRSLWSNHAVWSLYLHWTIILWLYHSVFSSSTTPPPCLTRARSFANTGYLILILATLPYIYFLPLKREKFKMLCHFMFILTIREALDMLHLKDTINIKMWLRPTLRIRCGNSKCPNSLPDIQEIQRLLSKLLQPRTSAEFWVPDRNWLFSLTFLSPGLTKVDLPKYLFDIYLILVHHKNLM